MPTYNTWDDATAIARTIQEDAQFVVRESYQLPNLITQFSDMAGGNLRKNYTYNQMTATAVSEDDDLVSSAFTNTAVSTLTPAEIGVDALVTDLRAASELPESIITDVAREMAFAAGDKIESDIISDFANLTGGTVGGTGTSGTPTGTILANGIARARGVNKSSSVPLACVIHGYAWAVLAASASIAGATVATAPGYIDEITRTGYVGTFMGVPLYQYYGDVTGGTGATAWAYHAIFPRNAIALDWRRPIRVEAQRDASMRGTEFTMSAVYAHGVWRPALGVLVRMNTMLPGA